MIRSTVEYLFRDSRGKSFLHHARRLSRASVLLATLLLFVSIVCPPILHAAPINYGSFMGNTVTYVDITENSASDPQHFPPNASPPSPNAGLYGQPFVSGDSLDFNPINFFALSNFQSPPFDHTDGHLKFMVVAKPGNAIENISFQEGGSLRVSGFGTGATYVDVSAVGFIDVLEVDGVPINKETINLDFLFNFGSNGAQNNGSWHLLPQGIVNGFLWNGGQFVDINAILQSRGIPVNFGATKINVALDNSLLAQSEPLAGAFIDKKDFGGLSVTVNIPEPTALMMGVMALLGLLVGHRRSSFLSAERLVV